MTFCFAFIVPGNGIGILSDTRISRYTKYGDIEIESEEFQKIWSPNQRCFFSFAGSIGLIKAILHDIEHDLSSIPDNGWYHMVQKKLKDRYIELISKNIFKSSEYSAQIIYASVRHKHGSQVFNLAEFEFSFQENTAIIITNRHKIDYASIGATPKIRKILTGAAIENMQDLYHRTASTRILSGDERKKMSKRLKIENIEDDAIIAIVDSRPNSGDKFSRTMRSFQRDTYENPSIMKPNETMLLGAAAVKAVEDEMKEIRKRGVAYNETIGNNWHLSILNFRDGLLTVNALPNPETSN